MSYLEFGFQFWWKSVFLRTYLGKLFDPKIHKNYLIEFNDFNGAVFMNFWVKRFSQVRSWKKQTLEIYPYWRNVMSKLIQSFWILPMYSCRFNTDNTVVSREQISRFMRSHLVVGFYVDPSVQYMTKSSHIFTTGVSESYV